MLIVRAVNMMTNDRDKDYGSNTLWNFKGYFDLQLPGKYKVTEFSKRVCRDIDKTTIVSEHLAISDILGDIPLSKISGGVQCLILAKYTNFDFPFWYFGENCLKYLLEICEEKDVVVIMEHLFGFRSRIPGDYPIKLENNGKLYYDDKIFFMDLAGFIADMENDGGNK